MAMDVQFCEYKNETKRKKKERRAKEKFQEKISYFTWNLEMERVLVDVLRDQRNMGYKGDRGWKKGQH